VRHTEFWARLEEALGTPYAQSWGERQVQPDLGNRTAEEALAAGVPPKEVWAVAHRVLDLPDRLR